MKKVSKILLVGVIFLLTLNLFGGKMNWVEKSYEKETRDYVDKIKGEIVYVNERRGYIALFSKNIPLLNKWDKTISCKEKLSGEKEVNKKDPLKCLILIEIKKTETRVRLTNLNSIKTLFSNKKKFNKWLKRELEVEKEIPLYRFITKGDKKNHRDDNIINYKINNSVKIVKKTPVIKESNEESFFDWKDKFIMILIGIIIIMGLVLLFFKKIIFKRTII